MSLFCYQKTPFLGTCGQYRRAVYAMRSIPRKRINVIRKTKRGGRIHAKTWQIADTIPHFSICISPAQNVQTRERSGRNRAERTKHEPRQKDFAPNFKTPSIDIQTRNLSTSKQPPKGLHAFCFQNTIFIASKNVGYILTFPLAASIARFSIKDNAFRRSFQDMTVKTVLPQLCSRYRARSVQPDNGRLHENITESKHRTRQTKIHFMKEGMTAEGTCFESLHVLIRMLPEGDRGKTYHYDKIRFAEKL